MKTKLLPILLLLCVGAAHTAHPQTATTPPVPDEKMLKSLPQCAPVTIQASDQPLEEVLKQLSQQAGFTAKCGMGVSDKRVTLSLQNTPFLAALAEICIQIQAGLELLQTSDGYEMHIEADMPIKKYQLFGPLLLTWHGLATTKEYNFEDPQNMRANTKYWLGVTKDPMSHAETAIDKALRDQPVTLIMADGQRLILQSDHKPGTFVSGQPDWQFAPRPELSGKKASSLEVDIPLVTPTRLDQTTLSYTAGQSATLAEAVVTLESVNVKKGKQWNSDIKSPEFMKEYEVNEFTFTIKLIHAKVKGAPPMGAEELMPPMDNSPFTQGPEGGLLAAHELYLVGKDQSRLKCSFRGADGISSPWHGFRFDATCRSKDLKFTPHQVAITWAAGFRSLRAPMKLQDIQFEAPH